MDNIEGEDRFGTAPQLWGRVKSLLIDLELLMGQQGASVIAA